MAWTPYQMLIAGIMVITGSINTLSTKWADKSESAGSDGTVRPFNHPFLQSCGMFLGELSCLLAFKILYRYYLVKQGAAGTRTVTSIITENGETRVEEIETSRFNTPEDQEKMPAFIRGNRTYNPIIFLAPAMCDLIATSTMYVGLTMTYASSFQMLRGALIIFTGFLSVAFLDKKLKGYQIGGILFIISGLAIVGASDLLTSSNEAHGRNAMITGDLLIITAQIITAVQMVLEERFVTKQQVSSLEAVGWEGFFGFIVMTSLLVPFYFINVGNQIFKNPQGRIEDAIDAFYQIRNNWQVATGFIGTILSISFFNFAGISVTKELSATTRTVLDSIRTFVVWLFSLAIKWQAFSWLQLLGFLVLMVGMFLYNNVIILPVIHSIMRRREAQVEEDERPIATNERRHEEEIVS